MGATELIHHAEEVLGIAAGQYGGRPVHGRTRRVPGRLHRGPVPTGQLPLPLPGPTDDFDALFDDLRFGRRDDEIPPHGTLARVRQHIPSDRGVGAVPPDSVTGPPAWIPPPTEGAQK